MLKELNNLTLVNKFILKLYLIYTQILFRDIDYITLLKFSIIIF